MDQPRGRTTPLHVAVDQAAETGLTEPVSLLLASGATVHVKDGDGNTPLHVVRCARVSCRCVVGWFGETGSRSPLGTACLCRLLLRLINSRCCAAAGCARRGRRGVRVAARQRRRPARGEQ